MKANIKWQLMRLLQQIRVQAIGAADSVDDILTILASSMLAVTPFSLNTMRGSSGSLYLIALD